MKKFLSSILMGTMIFTSVAFATDVTERSDIELVVNGTTIVNENVPIIVNSRTLIPLRDLVTKLGVPDDNEHIIWNEADRTVVIIHNDTTIKLTIDSDVATVNGNEMKLDAPAIIYNSRTYIPARFVGEALNKKIGWDNYESKVLVRDMEVYNEVKNAFTKTQELMSNVKKIKNNSSIDMGYSSIGSIMEMSMYTEMDIDKKQIYTAAEIDFLGQKNIAEQYYNNGSYYMNDGSGKWELVSTEYGFEELVSASNDFIDINIEDDTFYDTFTVDYEKSNENIIVLKNDLQYTGLLQEVMEMQSENGMIDNTNSEVFDDIKNLEYIYQINKKTGYLEKIDILMTIWDSEQQDDMYMNITMEVKDCNVDFAVYSPVE